MSRRKTTIYTAVVLVGFAALVIDQLTKGPGEAQAIATETDIPASPAKTDTKTTRQQRVEAATFPGPFPEMRPILQDPFSPPEEMFQKNDPKTQEIEQLQEQRQQVQSEDDFVASNKLSSIIRMGKNSIAIVNGQLIRPGESVNDWTLLRIEGQHAVFGRKDSEIKLSVLPKANSLPLETKAENPK